MATSAKKSTAKKRTPTKAPSKAAASKAAAPTSAGPEPHLAREQLPIPDAKHVGLTTYDAKDPNTKYPPIKELRPPEGAPNVLIVLIDDVGFGASSAFGGPVQHSGCRTARGKRLEAQQVSHHGAVLTNPAGDADRT